MKKKFWTILIALLVVIQFIPYSIKNEMVDGKNDIFAIEKASDATQALIRAACYDCHSQEAKKPWYAYVAPVKFWVNLHTRGGRQNLDFSKWGHLSAKDKRHLLEECVEVIQDKEMPLNSYTWMHPEAKLSDAQRSDLVSFFKSL